MRTCALVASLGLAVATHAAPALAQTGQKPSDGTTASQPFAAGTGESANFRIPAMVTLGDGTVVAATDARWNTTGDGGGLDTIVSRSTDSGVTWNYTFANYLGDNGNAWNALSTCFIDPALATDGSEVHMVVDLFPAGIALNSARWVPQTGDAFDTNGNLRLRDASLVPFDTNDADYAKKAAAATYDYYLDLSDHVIRRAADGSQVEGYAVDDHFNITSLDGSVSTNLFCGDSPFMAYPTNYLYFTTSKDGGATWGAPTLINAKGADEQTLLVGPGTGSVLADGTIMYSVYEYTSGRQVASVIWSSDGGKTWQRSADTTTYPAHWSSEAVTVPIDDTTVRQFYRDGYSTLYYTDFSLQNGAWVPGEAYDTGLTKTYNNQLSAIRYNGKIDGRDAVIVSTAASGTNARTDGRLYVGLLNDDGSMTWQYSYRVVPGGTSYSYSTLAQLSDGSVAVLYEDTNGTENFVSIPLDQIVNDETDMDVKLQDVALNVGKSTTLTDPSGNYTSADISGLDTSVATLALAKGGQGEAQAQLGGASGYTGDTKPLASALYTFARNFDGSYAVSAKAQDGSTVWLSPSVSTSAGYPNAATQENVTVSAGAFDGAFYLRGVGVDGKAGGYVYFDRSSLQLNRVNDFKGNATWMANSSVELYRPVAEGEDSSAELPGYVRVTNTDSIPGGSYLVVFEAANGERYVLWPTTDASSRRSQVAHVLAGATDTTALTFTGVAAGSTKVRVGDVIYRVTVTDPNVYVNLEVGESKTLAVAGDLTGADTSSLDKDVASLSVVSQPGAVSGEAAAPLASCEYDFEGNAESGFVVSSKTVDGDPVYLSPMGTGSGFPFSRSVTSLTISAGAEEGTFYLYDGSRYLFFWKDASSASHGTWDRVSTTGGFEAGSSLALFRASADVPESEIPGYERVTSLDDVVAGRYLVAAQDSDGSWYVLRPSVDASSKSSHVGKVVEGALTELTFTGVAAGTTSVVLGGTPYVVTVSADESPTPSPDTPGAGETNPEKPNPPATNPTERPGGTGGDVDGETAGEADSGKTDGSDASTESKALPQTSDTFNVGMAAGVLVAGAVLCVGGVLVRRLRR